MKKTVRFVISSLVAIGLLYIFFKGADLKSFLKAIKQANPVYLTAFALLLPVFYFIRAIRWRTLFPNGTRPSVKTFFLANIIGFSINYILPGRVGEIGRALYISKKGEVSSAYSIGTVVVERFFDAFSIGVLLLIYLVLYPVRSSPLKSNLYTIIAVSIIASTLLIAGIIIVETMIKKGIKAPFQFLLRVFPEKIQEKIKNSTKSLILGMNFLSPPSRAISFILWGFIVWLSVIIQYWFGLKAFSINKPPIEVIPYTAVLLVGVSIPTPGMAGGFEVASKFFISDIWHYPQNIAIASTITLHILLLMVTLTMGIFVGIKESFLEAERQT